MTSHSKNNQAESPYISPKELSDRWKVSRSSVDRIARRGGFICMYLGEGKNGTVRYLREEVQNLSLAIRFLPE